MTTVPYKICNDLKSESSFGLKRLLRNYTLYMGSEANHNEASAPSLSGPHLPTQGPGLRGFVSSASPYRYASVKDCCPLEVSV